PTPVIPSLPTFPTRRTSDLEIWRRLEEVGLNSKQTGMDNVRGVCGCPAAGLTPHELLNATPVIDEFTKLILDNREFTNLPRKFKDRKSTRLNSSHLVISYAV